MKPQAAARSRPELDVKTPCRLEIRALAGKQDTAEVMIYGNIGDTWDSESVTAAAFVRDLQNLDAKTLNVRINSIGGSVKDGLAIFNALQRHPATVDVYVDGMALSIASLIAMAGATVHIAENALMMVHAPWVLAAGSAKDLRDSADMLDKMATGMATSYAGKTGRKPEEMLALLTDGKDHWYTAAEAVEAGFADEITAAVEAKAQFDLSRFRGAPAAAAAFSSARSANMTPEELAAKAAADKAASDKAIADKAIADKAAADAAAAAAATALANAAKPGRTKEQNEELKAAFGPFLKRDGVQAVFEGVLMDPAVTVEGARAQLLTQLGKGTEPANPAAHVQMGATEADKFRAAAVEAILVRAGGDLATKEMRAKISENPFRGHKMLDMARASLDRARVDHRRMSQLEVVAAAFTTSTSDFPVLLENVLHKALQAAYGTTPDTWTTFCSVGSVSDFRASNRYRLGSFGNLDVLNENSEFKYKTVPDGEKASITAATKGNLINLSRQMMINDDLGAFVGLAAGLGRAARRTIEVDVYALLAQNSGLGPTMSDTHPLFDAAHGNIAATGAIAVSVFDDARVKMASQKDVSGNDYLDLRPSVLLIPIGTGGQARVINQSQYDTEVSSKFQVPNKVVGLFQRVTDTPRLSGTRFYMFADPTIAPVIEVAFLDGNQEPYIELQQGFEVDGAAYKVRLDYGTGVIDYRGAVTGAGA
jgi:ATP-dependent protease ClpP protease subunit